MFQIWVNKNSKYYTGINLRLTRQPPISHDDFKIWQYNATPEAVKYIDEDWEIATYRQGYFNYNNLFSHEDYEYIREKMTGEKKQQFFFIKPITEEARDIITNMDSAFIRFINMKGKVNSLNASVAAGILLAEIKR